MIQKTVPDCSIFQSRVKMTHSVRKMTSAPLHLCEGFSQDFLRALRDLPSVPYVVLFLLCNRAEIMALDNTPAFLYPLPR